MRELFRSARLSGARRVSRRPPPLRRTSPADLDGAGWYVAPALPPTAVADLAALAARVMPATPGGFWATAVMAPRDVATDVDRELKRIVGPHLAGLLPRHSIFLASIIAKGGTTSDEVAFHQDWTFTDERTTPTTLCWIPLRETDERSGAMRVVDGSHRWSTGIRPSGDALPTDPFPEHLQHLMRECATTVGMRAGDALVYRPSLLHGSWPNRVRGPRVAVALALASDDAELVHFHSAGGTLQGYAVTGSHFTSSPFGAVPDAPQVDPWTSPVTVQEIADALVQHCAR